MPAVTSRPPRSRSRSTTTAGGPVAASRRPTASASVLAPRPPEAPTTAVAAMGHGSGCAVIRHQARRDDLAVDDGGADAPVGRPALWQRRPRWSDDADRVDDADATA